METKLIVNDDGYSIFEDDKLIMKFNEDGVIRFKNIDNVLNEYDKNGMCTYTKTSTFEGWAEYNEHRKPVHYIYKYPYSYRYSAIIAGEGYCKEISCHEVWIEYDENDNEIHFKTDTGFETFSNYDDKGRIVYHKCISDDPFETWVGYDKVKHIAYHKTFYEGKYHYSDSNYY